MPTPEPFQRLAHRAAVLFVLVFQIPTVASAAGEPSGQGFNAVKDAAPASASDGAVKGVAPSSAQSARSASALPRELGKPEQDLQLDVRAYQVDGLPGASAAELAAVTAPFTGTARQYEDLSNAVAAVTRYLQRRLGYYVGMAYLPEQKLQDGVVHIFALEGRLDDIQVRWPAAALPVQREVIERYLTQLKPGEILRERDLERVVYLVNDLAGVRARFEIEPGREPGSASIVVTPEAEPRVSGRLEYDTLGSRNTGVSRFGARAAMASPAGLGDTLQLNLRGSASGGLQEGGASYSVPVGARGLKLGAVLSEVRYALPSVAGFQNIHGTATLGNVFGLYPVVRSRNLNLFALATVAHKRFDDRWGAEAVRRSTHAVQLGVLGDYRDAAFGGAVSTYELSLLQGGVSLGPLYSLSGLQANYRKLDVSWSRLQSLVPGRLHLYLRARGQFASTNLDPSERLPIGGTDGVRAFDPAEGAADDAQLLTAELRWLPPASLLGAAAREIVFSTFYDWGHVRYAHAPDALGPIAAQLLGPQNRATLGAFGVGVIWERPHDFTVRFDLAWRVQGQPSTRPNTHLPRAEMVLSKAF